MTFHVHGCYPEAPVLRFTAAETRPGASTRKMYTYRAQRRFNCTHLFVHPLLITFSSLLVRRYVYIWLRRHLLLAVHCALLSAAVARAASAPFSSSTVLIRASTDSCHGYQAGSHSRAFYFAHNTCAVFEWQKSSRCTLEYKFLHVY